jgi:hypothetical protein
MYSCCRVPTCAIFWSALRGSKRSRLCSGSGVLLVTYALHMSDCPLKDFNVYSFAHNEELTVFRDAQFSRAI